MEVNSNVAGYLSNLDFLEAVFGGDEANIEYWRSYIALNPECKKDILQAKYILLHLDELDSEFSQDEVNMLKNRIMKSVF